MNATIRSNGELTIPSQIRLAFHLAEGDEVEFEVAEKRLLPRRMDFVDHDPWYSDTPEWQEGVERALAETEAGKGTYVDSGEAFLEAIRRMSENADV
jgi:AbrB family looped-hinge helix DNA binding protein